MLGEELKMAHDQAGEQHPRHAKPHAPPTDAAQRQAARDHQGHHEDVRGDGTGIAKES
jgi:hypothetical protein